MRLWSENNLLGIFFMEHLSLIGGEKVISLSHTKGLRIFRFCFMLWKDAPEPTIKLCMGRQVYAVQEFITITALDTIDGEPMEFEWNIFPGFTTLQLCNKVQEFLLKMSESPEEFIGRIIFMSMLNDISWGSPDNEQECQLSANLVSLYARRFFTRKMGIPRTWIREEMLFYF